MNITYVNLVSLLLTAILWSWDSVKNGILNMSIKQRADLLSKLELVLKYLFLIRNFYFYILIFFCIYFRNDQQEKQNLLQDNEADTED